MIAALGMYDRAETAAAHDRLWALVRARLAQRGIEAPERLTRGEGAYWPAWTSADLLLGQTCGFPYRARLHGRVALVATPDYGLPGCPSGHYYSVYVVRQADAVRPLEAMAGARMAFNEELSQSGWAAAQTDAAARGFHWRPHLRSGSHRASARAVAEGRADIAAIDAQTWRLIQRHDAFAAGLHVLGQTRPATPALPFITAAGRDPEPIAAALGAAIAALSPQDREATGLCGLVRLPAAAYLAVPTPPSPAELGFSAD